MSSIVSLNNSLHRQLKNGTQYNKYFSNVSCKSQFLGKGKTSFGLQQMKKMVLKYQHQTKKIAKVLEKKTIPATVLNIKKFLYDHLQYSADGWDQNLRSPNCSWQTRKEGIDCKSYSLFAMSILFNLKIPNISFRKITQPSSPDKWSHVYVVVKHNNQELIIDATVPYNYEVTKVKHEDLTMEKDLPYYGLNAPQTGVVVNRKTFEVTTALNNFQNYLDSLEQRGVSKTTTDAIWYEVKSYLEKGVEPNLEINTKYIKIENKKFDFGLNPQNGLGAVITGAAIAIGAKKVLSNLDFGKIFGSLTNLFKTSDDAGISRIIIPFQKHIEERLASATDSNLHTIASEIDEHLNAFLSHANYVNSRFGKVYIPKLKEMLTAVRSSFSDMPYTEKKGTKGTTFKEFWSGPNATLVHAGKIPYTYREYSPASKNLTFTGPAFIPIATQSKINNILSQLVPLANGLFQDNSTGEILTEQKVTALQNGQIPENYKTQIDQKDEGNDKGMSTNTKIAIGVGAAAVLAIGIYVAKTKNII